MTNKYWPLARGSFTISSGFGQRINPVTGSQEGHLGLDFAAPKGTPFYSPGDGICVEGIERAHVEGFGQWVWLDLQRSLGVDIIIGHGDPAVHNGEAVRAGQLIGYVNTHGQSTGPHAHVEVWNPPGRIGGQAIDPAKWFEGALDPGQLPTPPKALKRGKMEDPTTRQRISPNCDDGPRVVRWIAIHTQEGGRTAAGLAEFTGEESSQVSYNALVDDKETILTVPWYLNPWSASNANSRADHICGAGTYAGWSRGKWLETDDSDGKNEDLELTRLAEITAWRCQVRGINPEYAGNYGKGPFPPAESGICGHMDFGSWGGGHHDPGESFPWDEFIRRVQAFYNGGTMGFLNETFENFKKKPVSVATFFYYADQYINEIRAQVVQGWAQLGKNEKGENLTLVDSQAAQTGILHQIVELETQILELQQKIYDILTQKMV